MITALKISLVGILLMLALGACKDPCKDNPCGDTGLCLEGVCTCNSGYELDKEGGCTVLSRNRFLGSFDAVESCSKTKEQHFISIVEHETIDKIIIENLYNHPNNNVTAQVTKDSFSFSEQLTADNFVLTGKGWAVDNAIYIQYKISNLQSLKDSCTVQLSRK